MSLSILGFLHPRSPKSQISAPQVPPSPGLNILDLNSLGLNTLVSPPWVPTSLKNKHNPQVTGQTGASRAEALARNHPNPQHVAPPDTTQPPQHAPFLLPHCCGPGRFWGSAWRLQPCWGAGCSVGVVVLMRFSPSQARAPPHLHSSRQDWPYMAGSRLPCSRSDKSH